MKAWKRLLLGVGAGGKWAGAQSSCGLGEEGGSDPVKKAVCWLAITIQGTSVWEPMEVFSLRGLSTLPFAFYTQDMDGVYWTVLFFLMLWHLCVCRNHRTTFRTQLALNWTQVVQLGVKFCHPLSPWNWSFGLSIFLMSSASFKDLEFWWVFVFCIFTFVFFFETEVGF